MRSGNQKVMIMSKRKYYDMLDKIGYENKKDINGQGFVALAIPFKGAGDAVTFILTDFPELTPADRAIEQNKPRCRELSQTIRPEVERLLHCVERMQTTARSKLDNLAAQRDGKQDGDLLESVEKKVLQEQVLRQSGYCEALHDVWRLLHDRRYELWECMRLKGGLSNVEKA